MFTKRLRKAKEKDLERKLYEATGIEAEKIKAELRCVKREVYTDERKVEQRKKNFDQAKHNTSKRSLSEFL